MTPINIYFNLLARHRVPGVMPKRSQGQGDEPLCLPGCWAYRCFVVKLTQHPATHSHKVEAEANSNGTNLCDLVDSDGRTPEAIITHTNQEGSFIIII